MERPAMDIRFHGMLHVGGIEGPASGLPGQDREQRLAISVDNAVTLSRSLARHGLAFQLCTDDQRCVARLLAQRGGQLQLAALPGGAPAGVRSQEADRALARLALFRDFARQRDQYSILVDLAMLCINPPPPEFHAAVASGQPLCHDVSAQVVPQLGAQRIAHDLELLHGMASAGRWYGSEFIAGTAGFFDALACQVQALWPEYLHHQDLLPPGSDELVTSAALERLQRQGLKVTEAGALELVARHTNAPVSFRQAPLRSLERHFLLHLPGEREFLSRLASRPDIAGQAPFELVVREARRPASLLRRYGLRLPWRAWWQSLRHG